MALKIISNIVQTTSSGLSAGFSAVAAVFRRTELKSVSPRNIVFVTGSDSGLGFNIALLCHSLNMTVVAGCRSNDSEGARFLRSVTSPERIITVEIDVTNMETISNAYKIITQLISDKHLEFTALINNAGVMCFGEFEWQTPSIFESQINVNLLGSMRVTHKLLPLIRQHHGRIINVTSHCGLQALPGISAYVASKAGLRYWTDALRIEMKEYDVKVVDFVPGSFVTVSNIASQQNEYAKEMWNGFNKEQKSFYGDYFKAYNTYLSALATKKSPIRMQDKPLFDKLQDALLNIRPKNVYIHEPWRYKFYHCLFKISPTPLRDYFIRKFLCMPRYVPRNNKTM